MLPVDESPSGSATRCEALSHNVRLVDQVGHLRTLVVRLDPFELVLTETRATGYVFKVTYYGEANCQFPF